MSDLSRLGSSIASLSNEAQRLRVRHDIQTEILTISINKLDTNINLNAYIISKEFPGDMPLLELFGFSRDEFFDRLINSNSELKSFFLDIDSYRIIQVIIERINLLSASAPVETDHALTFYGVNFLAYNRSEARFTHHPEYLLYTTDSWAVVNTGTGLPWDGIVNMAMMYVDAQHISLWEFDLGAPVNRTILSGVYQVNVHVYAPVAGLRITNVTNIPQTLNFVTTPDVGDATMSIDFQDYNVCEGKYLSHDVVMEAYTQMYAHLVIRYTIAPQATNQYDQGMPQWQAIVAPYSGVMDWNHVMTGSFPVAFNIAVADTSVLENIVLTEWDAQVITSVPTRFPIADSLAQRVANLEKLALEMIDYVNSLSARITSIENALTSQDDGLWSWLGFAGNQMFMVSMVVGAPWSTLGFAMGAGLMLAQNIHSLEQTQDDAKTWVLAGVNFTVLAICAWRSSRSMPMTPYLQGIEESKSVDENTGNIVRDYVFPEPPPLEMAPDDWNGELENKLPGQEVFSTPTEISYEAPDPNDPFYAFTLRNRATISTVDAATCVYTSKLKSVMETSGIKDSPNYVRRISCPLGQDMGSWVKKLPPWMKTRFRKLTGYNPERHEAVEHTSYELDEKDAVVKHVVVSEFSDIGLIPDRPNDATWDKVRQWAISKVKPAKLNAKPQVTYDFYYELVHGEVGDPPTWQPRADTIGSYNEYVDKWLSDTPDYYASEVVFEIKHRTEMWTGVKNELWDTDLTAHHFSEAVRLSGNSYYSIFRNQCQTYANRYIEYLLTKRVRGIGSQQMPLLRNLMRSRINYLHAVNYLTVDQLNSMLVEITEAN
jgi:hypothetical protein